MKKISAILFLVLIFLSFSNASFKDEQRRYPRVRKAYTDKDSIVKNLSERNFIDIKNLNIYLRVFKLEKKIELWAKNKTDNSYKMIKEYDICSTSGRLGPKRKRGDLQIPEGFYHISGFNPYSNFYLSLRINYPNKSDKILGVKGKLGGDIFIHGDCVTIGCIPITDDKIKELYILCVEAKNNGQTKIPVTIYPTKLTDNNYSALKTRYQLDSDKLGLWADLKQGYDYFEETKRSPNVLFLDNGRHIINK
jgi:murein L,D-transpeptidase YafK